MKPCGEVGDLARQESDLPKSRYRILHHHISREFLLSFAVSFVFFFFIFFINQILLLVQKILLKNVSISEMISLVSLAIPQFLLYTIPFSTLSASSMVLGDLSASNELLALRSSGIPMRSVYSTLLRHAVFLSILTYLIADFLMPWSAVQYKEKLSNLMRDLPTFEIASNSVNTVGTIVLVNGSVEGDTIKDIILFDTGQGKQEQCVSAESGTLTLIDLDKFVYRLDLVNPQIITNERSNDNYGMAKAESASFYLDFSAQVPALTSSSPTSLSSKDLLNAISKRKELQNNERQSYLNNRFEKKGEFLSRLDKAVREDDRDKYESTLADYDAYAKIPFKLPTNFYYQYYNAELQKKFSLSLACFALTVMTLPLSFIRIKHGRLTGFGLSLLIAVAYWYLLFASQMFLFKVTFNAGFLVWIPDIVMLVIGLVVLKGQRR